MHVRLNHYCNLEGSKGKPGEVVEVNDDLATRWIAEGAAVKVDPPADKRKKVSKKRTASKKLPTSVRTPEG